MKNILLVLSFAAVTTYAGNYGMAGCGLGSLVIKEDGMVQVLAATTNATSGSQTFGITSGTSNCAEDGVALKSMEQEYFTEANHESLIQEMAQGHGESLNTLAELFSVDAKTFASMMQSNYNDVVDADAYRMVEKIRLVLAKS